jgi:hypothetical protein
MCKLLFFYFLLCILKSFYIFVKILTMRILMSIFLFVYFGAEFLLKSSHHKLYAKYLSDKELHFLAFLIIPFFIYVLLSKYKYAYIFSSSIFLILTYYIEHLQRLLGNRSYSMQDFKYSLFGFSIYLLLILFLKALSYKERALE